VTTEQLRRCCVLYKIAFNLKYIERINFYVRSCNSESDISLVSNNRDTKQMLSIVEPFGTYCCCVWYSTICCDSSRTSRSARTVYLYALCVCIGTQRYGVKRWSLVVGVVFTVR